MKKTNFKLNEEICKAFDIEWYQVWVFDKLLYLPKPEEVKEMLAETNTEHAQYRRELYDCDDFSIALLAAQRTWAAKSGLYELPWAFFRVSGIRCRGMVIVHHWNMASTPNGIYFCESMSGVDRFWKFEGIDRDQIIMAHT
jgi:hypothetical protein